MENNHAEPPEPEKLLEAALTPFDRRVAVTIAALTAALAFVSMLDSSTHSEMLQFQIAANREQINSNSALAEEHDARARSAESLQRAERARDIARIANLLSVDASARAERDKLNSEFETQAKKFETDADVYQRTAEAENRKAVQFAANSQDAIQNAFRTHKVAKSIDRAELLIQLAIVLCSLAILTKRRWYWLIGGVLGLVGWFAAIIAVSL